MVLVQIFRAFASVVLLAASPEPPPTLHYAANGNFDNRGQYTPGAFGFNMSDVSKPRDLMRLPQGVMALVWVGRCGGADDAFVADVTPFLRDSRVFGFYLMDDPDPTWWRGRRCPAENLRDEADWIHSRDPNARTFITLMNLGTSLAPNFLNSYGPENTHIDLFGLSPYPCRTEAAGCDFNMIARFVIAATAAGIPLDRIVPTYQAFGGGSWVDDGDGKYVLPSSRHELELFARWEALIGRPVFDYTYSWGSQRDDGALENSPTLLSVFAAHNGVAVQCGHESPRCGTAVPP
jgi:hypothetical protein